MKRSQYLFLVLALVSQATFAQKPQRVQIDPVETNLHRTIEYLASDALQGRRAGEPGAMLAAGFIANQFAKLKLKPSARTGKGKASYLQPFSFTPVRDPHRVGAPDEAAKRFDAFNVVGVLDGHDPILRNEAIVIGAHYDHLGHGGDGSLAANSTEIHHGADDNASGVAAIIELARQFARDKNNKRTLIFIAFSGEEEGLFGSSFYVNNPVFPLDKTVAMINLDMVGRLKDDKLTIGGIGTANEWKDMVAGLNLGDPPRMTDVAPNPNRFTLQLNDDGFGPSDHSSFYGKKIPVLFFFTGTHNDYHKPSDTADKINYAGEHKIIEYLARSIGVIDRDAKRPTYAVAKSANTGGRTGFKISLGTIPNYSDSTDGMLLDGVRDGSPAAMAGLRSGDKVVKLAGRDIRNVYDYTDALVDMKADEEYEIVVLRGGERLTMKIVPVKR
jgi:aminopeptidase YwaD